MPGTYITCETCSVKRNADTIAYCPVCLWNEQEAARPRPPRRANVPRWVPRTVGVPFPDPLTEEELARAQTPEGVFSLVAERHNLPVERLLGHTRDYRASQARFELAYLLQQILNSTPRVGRLMRRHHTTVMYDIFQYKAAYQLSTLRIIETDETTVP